MSAPETAKTARIGSVEIPGRVSLAPLAGVTDLPFRLLCKEFGASMMTTEMVSSEGLVRRHAPTLEYARFDERERPIAVQIYGGEPEVMAEAARIVVEETGPEIVDVNFGCPVKKIVGKGAGSACLREPERLGDILAAMVDAVDVPVTAKIRAGWDRPVAVEIAQVAESAGASAVTIHGRTRDQAYKGSADWGLVKAARAATSDFSIVGNGDVQSAPDALARIEETGCDLVMIGRGAMGRPWIFRQVAHFFETGECLPEPSLRERIDVALRHYQSAVEAKGPVSAVREMRSHLAAYFKDLPLWAELRPRIMKETDPDAVMTLLRETREEKNGS